MPRAGKRHPALPRSAAIVAACCALISASASFALAKPGVGGRHATGGDTVQVHAGQAGVGVGVGSEGQHGQGRGEGRHGQGGGEGPGLGPREGQHGQGGGEVGGQGREGDSRGHGHEGSADATGATGQETPHGKQSANGQAQAEAGPGSHGDGHGGAHGEGGGGAHGDGHGGATHGSQGQASKGKSRGQAGKGKASKGSGVGVSVSASTPVAKLTTRATATPTPTPTSTPPPATNIPAAPAATPVAAAPTGAAPAAANTPSAPAAVGSSPRRRPSGSSHRRGHRARRGGESAVRLPEGITSFAPGLGPSARLAAAAESLPARGDAKPAARATPAKASIQPPIVQTITKIVGVVPTAVWIALAALAALAAVLAVGSRLLALRARRLERQRGELLADVGLLQTTLLPAPPARRGALSSTVAHRPADGPAAGGDFYDVFTLPDGSVAAIVGDVSGHGREALPYTALVRYTLRAYLEAGLSPREALQTAGTVLERQLEGVLASALIAAYRPRERTLVYAGAGHPPPLVLGTRTRLAPVAACSAPPIGTGMRTGTRQTVLSLRGAANVCLHTDGVTDARVGPELYGAERLARALRELGPDATADALLDRVTAQTDVRPDDMAACLLSIRGGAAEPATLVQELELEWGEGARERAERFLLACGVDLAAAACVAGEASSQAEQAGSALLEVRMSADSPIPSLRGDDAPDIHASDTRLLATVGAAR